MEFIKSEWYVNLNFNQIHIMGIAPLTNSFVNMIVENTMIAKATESIYMAEKYAECTILSYVPKTLQDMINENIKNDTIVVAFTVMFKDFLKARQYYENIKRLHG